MDSLLSCILSEEVSDFIFSDIYDEYSSIYMFFLQSNLKEISEFCTFENKESFSGILLSSSMLIINTFDVFSIVVIGDWLKNLQIGNSEEF